MSQHRDKPVFVACPKCYGCKCISGRSAMRYPATLPCDRCDAVGEVNQNSLTELEKNPPKPIRYNRDDL